ncbi:hypothetical protein SSTG_03939 [Streptomyces sp. e14]|nr:hypothetical protein SSTG_03939 [Streptomyces sp. e14]
MQDQPSAAPGAFGGLVQQFGLSAAAGAFEQHDGTLSGAAFAPYSFELRFLLVTFDQIHWFPPYEWGFEKTDGPKLATLQGAPVSPRTPASHRPPIGLLRGRRVTRNDAFRAFEGDALVDRSPSGVRPNSF